VSAALMGLEDANDWFFTYYTSASFDILILQSFGAAIKLKLIQFSMHTEKWTQLKNILKKIIGFVLSPSVR